MQLKICTGCGDELTESPVNFRHVGNGEFAIRCWPCEDALGQQDDLPKGPTKKEEICLGCILSECIETDSLCQLNRSLTYYDAPPVDIGDD